MNDGDSLLGGDYSPNASRNNISKDISDSFNRPNQRVNTPQNLEPLLSKTTSPKNSNGQRRTKAKELS